MTDPILEDLREFWRRMFHQLRPIIDAWEEINKATREVLDEVKDTLTTYQEREKKRAYEHMITPPLDHTLAQVTHTSSKPPHPHRTYRRRTP